MFDGIRDHIDESRFNKIIKAAKNGQVSDKILEDYKANYYKFCDYFYDRAVEMKRDEVLSICYELDLASIKSKDEFWKTHSLSWMIFGDHCKWLSFDKSLFCNIINSAIFYKVPIELFLESKFQYMAFVGFLNDSAYEDINREPEMSADKKRIYADVYSNLGIELPSFLISQDHYDNFNLFKKITMQPDLNENKNLYREYIGPRPFALKQLIFLNCLIEKEEKKEITKEQVDKILEDNQIHLSLYEKASNYRKIAEAVTSAKISAEIKDKWKNIFEGLYREEDREEEIEIFECWFHFYWMPKLLRDGRIQDSQFRDIYQKSLSKMNEEFSADFSVTSENGGKQIQKEAISAANKVQVAGGQIIMDSLESQDPMLIPAIEESSKQTQEEVVSAEQTIHVDRTKDRADSLASESGVLDSIEADKHEISTNGNDKSSTSSDEGVNGDGGEVPLVEIPSSGEDGKDSSSALASESGDEALEADYEIPDNGNDKPSTGSDEGVNGDGGEVPLVEIPSSGEDEKDSSSALASESGDEALEADAYEISEKGNDKSSTSSDEGVNGDGGEESSEGSDEEVHENDGKGSPTDSDEEIHGNDGKGFPTDSDEEIHGNDGKGSPTDSDEEIHGNDGKGSPTGLDNGKDNTTDEKVLPKMDSKVADSFLHVELASYLSGDPVNEKIIENWKKISDKDMVIDAIVDSLSKVGIEDEEKRNAIVGRASNLLQTLSTEEDSKDLYELLEERITAEIKKLYSDYDSKEDKSSEISNRQALINALNLISSGKESKEESHDIELPYLTYDQFKYMSSYKERGILKQYLMEVHLAEVAYGDNWKEKFKIPDFTKKIEKWNRGVEDAKKVTFSDEEKADLRKRCLDEIEGFIDGTKEPNPDLRFAAGLKLLSDSFDIGDSKEKIDGYISVLKSFYDKLNRFKDENKIYGDKYNEYKGKVLEKIDDIYQDKINKINDYITKCRDSEKNCTNDEKSYKRYEEIINMLNHKLKQLEDEKNKIKNEIKNNDFAEKKEKSKDETPKVDEESRKDVLKKKVFAGIAGFTGGVLTAVFAPAPVVAVAGTILLVNRIVKLAGVVGLGLNKYAETHQDGKIAKLVASYNSFIDKPIISKVVKAYNNPYVQWALSGFTAGIFVGSFYKNVFAPQSSASDAKEVASSTRKPSGGNGGTGSSDTVVDQALDNPSPRDASSAAVSAPSKGPDLDLTHFDASNMHSAYYTSYDTNPVSIQSDLFADTKVINTNVVNGQLKVALGAQDGTPLGWFNAEDIGVTQDMINEAVNNGGIKLL